MSRLSFGSTIFALFLSLGATSASGQDSGDPQKTGYSVGVQMGTFLEPGKDLFDLDSFIRGLQDTLAGKNLEISKTESEAAFRSFQKAMNEKQGEAQAAAGNAYLDENAKKEGVVVLPSGLQYKIIKEGAGPKPQRSDRVSTHYAGRLIDGTEFDSSYKRGQPAAFGVTQVIAGWTEALQLMPVGSKWELYIPYSLAYGTRGSPPLIGPYATLIFEIEVLEIVKPK